MYQYQVRPISQCQDFEKTPQEVAKVVDEALLLKSEDVLHPIGNISEADQDLAWCCETIASISEC